MKIVVTGAAGFIGSQVVAALIKRGDQVVGIDNINDYYDPTLKYSRLIESGVFKQDIVDDQLVDSRTHNNYRFIKCNIENSEVIDRLFKQEKFDKVCHLAAQAGVRYSIENPRSYIDSNVVGFLNILEASRRESIKHLVYASSSSVYGKSAAVPFSELECASHPASLYAATKRANELMAHSYSSLYSIPTTGLRFFTVYGPKGRPDMAPMLFADAIVKGESIKVFNNGDMLRDFTYIDDIVEGVVRVIDHNATINREWVPTNPEPSTSCVPYRIYNIGNSDPVKLMTFIDILEREIGLKAQRVYMPMQQGDVYQTNADTSLLDEAVGFKPSTSLEDGIKEFIRWYKEYYL
ncbi:MAG: NAD-dependent epimerase [Bacteroidales bacterium]